MTKNIEDADEKSAIRRLVIDKLGQELDITAPRIIADGRAELITDMESLKSLSRLYARYPKIKITDRMVELNKDKFAQMFDISRM